MHCSPCSSEEDEQLAPQQYKIVLVGGPAVGKTTLAAAAAGRACPGQGCVVRARRSACISTSAHLPKRA